MSTLDLNVAAERYQDDPGPDQLQALVEAAEGMIVKLARMLGGGHNTDDLIQSGFEGLLKAVRRFEPERGVKFSTFAYHYIAGEIRHQIRKEMRYERPGWLADLQSRVYLTIDQLAMEKGELPSLAEVAKALNIREEGIVQAIRAGRVSFDEIDVKKIRHIYYESFALPVEDRIVIRQALEGLSELTRKVLYMVYYLDMTQDQVGRELGIGQRRVSRIIRRGLAELAPRLA